MKRLRITFAKDESIKYTSHLDLVRAWERVLRRANVPLAYSKGFNPHPRLSVAVPLPVGLSGDAELVDIVEDGDVDPEQIRQMIEPQMPPGLRIVDIVEVPLDERSLQARLSFAEYSIDLIPSLTRDEVQTRIANFLAASRIERQRRRVGDRSRKGDGSGPAEKARTYDLRSLVDSIWMEEQVQGAGPASKAPSLPRLLMRLRSSSGADGGQAGMGRPDDVLEALGLTEYVERIRRTKLVIDA